MDLSPLVPADRQIIQSYGDGGFRVSGTRHEGSVLIFPGQTSAWPVVGIDALTLDSLSAVLRADPAIELLLIGTGARMAMIPPALRRQFRDHGVMIDAMDTGAACRTYNVLLAEERRIAAALMAV